MHLCVSELILTFSFGFWSCSDSVVFWSCSDSVVFWSCSDSVVFFRVLILLHCILIFQYCILILNKLYSNIVYRVIMLYCQEEFEDTIGVISTRKSEDRQHNGQKKRDKNINNDLQTLHIKLKIK